MNMISIDNYSRPVLTMDDSSVKIQVRHRRATVLLFAVVTLLVSLMGGAVFGQDASITAPFASFPITQNSSATNQVVFSQFECGTGSATANCIGFTGSVNTLRIDNNIDYFDVTTANSTINKIQIRIQSNNSNSGVAVVGFSSNGTTWANFSELSLPANSSCTLHEVVAPAGAKYFRVMRTGFGGYTASGTTGLTVRIYYVAAWVNAAGTAPSVTTSSASSVSTNSSTLNGSISNIGTGPVTVRGFVVHTSANPTLETGGVLSFSESGAGFSTGNFSLSASGLNAGTLYYVRAYASSIYGVSYGQESPNIQFTTLAGPPTVTIGSLGTVTTTGAPITGNNVTSTGGALSISGRGIVYNKTGAAPSIASDNFKPHASGALGNYDITLAGLDPGTTYYAWAYATNSNGLTGYSNNSVSFTTKANYRSKQDGLWSDASTWEVFNGSMWVNAAVPPTNADGTIQIQNGNEVTVAEAVSADQLTIDDGGQLSVASGQTFTVANGSGTDVIVNGRLKASGVVNTSGTIAVNSTGVYEHNLNGDIADGITWNTGSTCEITGITSGYEENGDLPSLTGTFQNLTWNCPSQGNFYIALGNNSLSIAGKFKIVSTGAGMLLTSAGATPTLFVGSYEQTGGKLFINRNSSSGYRAMQVNGDASITGGSEVHIKTLGGNTEGSLILKGNLTMAPSASLLNSGTNGSATLIISGTTAQNLSFGLISGTIAYTVDNSSGINLNSNWTIPAGSLALMNGKVNTDVNKVSVSSGVTVSPTNGYVNGRLEKGIATATASKTFEIGDASNYTPISISFAGSTNGAGTLTASTTATDHPDIANSGIAPTRSANRYFSVENNGVASFTSFGVTLNYVASDIDAGATEASFKVKKYSTATSPDWIAATSSTAGTNTITGSGFTSFSDFAIGEVSIPTTTSITNVVATYGDGVVSLTAGIIPPQATGLIHFFINDLEVGTSLNVGGFATLEDIDITGLAVGPHVIRAEYYTDGTYESSVSENGELVIHPKQLTVTISAAGKTYDGNTDAAVSVATVDGIVGSDDVTVSASNGQFDTKDAGTGKTVTAGISLSGADAGNYTLVNNTESTTADIERLAVIIAITANDKTYDGNTDAVVTAVNPIAGVIGGDDVTASASNGQFATANAGVSIAVTADVSASGDDAGNYTFNSVANTTADITKSDATIVVNGYTGTYDGSVHGATVASAVGVNNEDLTSSVLVGEPFKNVPGGVVDWSFSHPNYNGQNGSVDIDIAAAMLTVDVDDETKYCGQADPSFTGTITGAVGSDVFTATYSVYGNAITATINENTDNYDVTINDGELTINGISIDASASSNPVAIGSNATLSATVSPATAGVSVSFYLDDVLKGSCLTNAAGTATITVTGLGISVYKVKAVAGAGCSTSIAYLPVYDPSGGFVTGGGWIMSPAGAYAADLDLTGKANFGFNAKYKKGSSAVDGNTEFNFHAAGLNFKSTQHNAGTLVIAGAKANFKGTGTINGLAGYSFMVSAIDGQLNGGGGVDKFRIKIWDANGIVYDNNMGVDDNGVPTTELGGGSIVIHEVKGGGKAAQTVNPDILVTSLDARVFNNPAAGASAWRVKILSPDQDHPITLRMVDMNGRPVESRQGITAGSTVELGATYQTGMYVAEISQNGQRKLVKLMKQ